MQLVNLFNIKKLVYNPQKIFLLAVSAMIILYQRFISIFFPPCCRFYPSCSTYSLQAIQQYGYKGFFYIFLRIIRCHPLCKGGFDPLPKKNG